MWISGYFHPDGQQLKLANAVSLATSIAGIRESLDTGPVDAQAQEELERLSSNDEEKPEDS